MAEATKFTGFRFSEFTLRNKIIILACSLSLITAIAMAVATSVRTQHLVREFAEGNVAHETRLVAQQVKGAYNELENDAFVISRTPPIDGFIRSKRNAGVDPVDGSTTEQWRTRLESIFSSVMEERPTYTQIRFIGIADGGREIVRVNRIDGGFERVPENALQQKGQEPYFQRARLLRPDEAYFSEVSYNREFGLIGNEFIPTIRSIVPIYGDDKTLYGIIVINADYSEIIQQYFREISVKRKIVISNDAGDYITHFSDGTISDFHFRTEEGYTAPDFLDEVRSFDQREWASNGESALSYSVRLPIERKLDGAHIVITISVPNDFVYAPARRTLQEGLLLSAFLLVLSMMLTYALARKMTAPLSKMTQTIEQAKDSDAKLDLPTGRNDEVGRLANAFQKLLESRKEHAARGRAVIDKVVDAIISIDDHGIVLSYNPASEKLFGYAPDEVIGQNIKMLMPHAISAAHDGYLAAFRQTGERHIVGVTRELEAQRKDGSHFPMELSVSKVDLGDGSYMFTGIIRDITERMKMAIMQNDFVSTVNHELRTPLTSIRASLGILERRIAGKVDEKSEQLVHYSLRGCDRLTRLVNDILDQEKIAAGKMDFHMEHLEIGELTQKIIKRNESLAEIYHVRFDLLVGFEGPQYCRLDSSRYAQALVNLLSNAAKFSPPGKPVKVSLDLIGADKIAVAVADEGSGIPESFREKIFQRFAQADSSATKAKNGSGLGLNITKSIIEAFDGTIDFESEEGAGSTFFITLPVCDPPANAGETQCQAA